MRPVAACLLTLLLACSGGEEVVASTPPTAPTTTLPATTTSGAAPPTFEEVGVEVSGEGTYLVDARGRSLYLFTLDTDRTSSCEGECAEAWPPLLGDPVGGEGVDQTLLGNAERGNGSIQVTYGGHPLYLYSGDGEAGDINGHGFNDVWFLVGPEGDPLD